MRLKFINLNLWVGGTLWDNIIDFLKKENPDIIALQEVFNGHDRNREKRFHTLDALQDELGYPHMAFSPTFFDKSEGRGIDVEEGNAIMSRFPVTSNREVFFDTPYQILTKDPGPDYSRIPRNLQHATLDIGETELNVFNTQGIWGFDGDDNERRLAQAQVIVKELGSLPRVILSGDFNVKEQTKSIALIEDRLKNIFKGERTTSFNLKHKTSPGFATAVVDMVFASTDLKVIEHYQPDVNVTDHLPQVVVFEL